MPWSNQGGGPWGSGGSKGPWGSGPQSSGPTPPDLEELLRRSQDRLKGFLPGGNLGGRGIRANQDVDPVAALPELAHLHLVQVGRLTERVDYLFANEGVQRLALVLLHSLMRTELLCHGHRISPDCSEPSTMAI